MHMCNYLGMGAGRRETGQQLDFKHYGRELYLCGRNLSEKKFESKGLKSSLGGSHASGLG